MIQIGDTIVSRDILEKHFACDLQRCRGACCIKGDAGAPLEADEVETLRRIYPLIKPYMRPEGRAVVEQQGVAVLDRDGDRVTPLIGSDDCVYSAMDGEVAVCAIEQAARDGVVDFLKPISCHLYPIRITRYPKFDALNYHRWEVCCSAQELGERQGTPLFVFLRDALTRKYGAQWYEQLCLCKQMMDNHNP